MNKKIFKALKVGLKLFIKRNLEILIVILIFFGVIPFVIVLLSWIMKIFNIVPKEGTEIPICLAIVIGVPWIIGSFIHAINAVRYSEEMKCTMEEAWKATTPIEPEEDF